MKSKIILFTLLSIFGFSLNANAQSYLAAGTQITMGDDTRKGVEDIAVGDVVLSYNVQEKVYEKKKVTATDKIMFGRTVRIVLDNGLQILATSDYPFWGERGWLSVDYEMTAENPKFSAVKATEIGDYMYFYDVLTTASERVAIVEGIMEPIMTHTLTIEGGGTIIGNGFILGTE